MGLVWRVRRLAASVWAELILWSLWSLVVLFSIGLPIYLGSNYLGEPDLRLILGFNLNFCLKA
jgi:hypothetical protein